MSKKIIIIGGGMAGLSAGAYLQMNGFNTEIFEMNGVPGGVCTSWKRGEYTVDWCIHWLVGSGSSDSFYARWSELIDMADIEVVDHAEYAVVEDETGNRFHIYTDLNRLEDEMMAISPVDFPKIREFIDTCKNLVHLEMPNEQSMEVANLWFKMKWLWKMLPYFGVFGKYSRISTVDYAQEFKNPLLRKAIANLFEPEIPILFCMMTLAWMHKKAAGYPIGGSMNFARRIADRFEALGGKIHYNCRVEKIGVENGRATGIQLADGATHPADYVVSAADGHSTLFDMLGGKFTSPKFEEFYRRGDTFPSLVFVALGIGRSFHATPHSYLFPLKSAFRIDPKTELKDLYIRTHNFDPTLAPFGKTLVSTMIETRNWEYWVDLQRNDPTRYQAEKQRIADTLINILEDKLGNVRDLVEMTDVTTPATIIGFTNNWKGSFEGWLLTPDTGFTQLPSTLPGLERFYMCGHWVAVGGGLPTAMMSGRNAAQLICAQERQRFSVQERV
jgi:phytoene dehydrogenase-like protein